MKITVVQTGLWDLGGRGKLERTPQGVFFVGLNDRDAKWSDEEISQMNKFIQDLKKQSK